MKTAITELFGIKYPLFQGGMAWISDWNLASAVSNAGGLGIIAGGNATADHILGEIQKTRAALKGDFPFGLNLMLMSPYCDDLAQLVIDERVPVVATGAGLPSKYMAAWIEAGIKVVPVVPSVAIARRVAREGASAVVAEGGESGGHVGETTTMALLPQVADAVDIPVIGAGGIADGRGIAAALMLGAEGVQLGTRFLVATECTVHENYKKKILAANDRATVTTGQSLGHPVRAIKTPFTRAFQENEKNPAMSKEDVEAFGAGALRRAAVDGDNEGGSFLAGQICGMVTREQSAQEIITELFYEADLVLKGAQKWVN